MKVTFWKFVQHSVTMTAADAKKLAQQIEMGVYPVSNQYGERYYKIGGWCFDLGRKAFLVQFSYGSIERYWAKSVAELRAALNLSRNDKVAPDPFFKKVPA